MKEDLKKEIEEAYKKKLREPIDLTNIQADFDSQVAFLLAAIDRAWEEGFQIGLGKAIKMGEIEITPEDVKFYLGKLEEARKLK